MADNITLNAGVGGDTVSADDIGPGVKVQRVKLQEGVDGAAADIHAAHPLPTEDAQLTTPATTNVAASAASVTLLAANASRKGLLLYNDSNAIAYVKYGVTASTSSFTHKLMPGEKWEPAKNYTGRVDAIWDSASGAMRITELAL